MSLVSLFFHSFLFFTISGVAHHHTEFKAWCNGNQYLLEVALALPHRRRLDGDDLYAGGRGVGRGRVADADAGLSFLLVGGGKGVRMFEVGSKVVWRHLQLVISVC